MDSVTQIVLGAACGEAVLGKKIGNRAMIWGGIGGTLPDLDVLGNLFLDPLNSLMFHRGPMHSLLFAIVMPFILGPLIKKLYEGNWHHKKAWKIFGFGFGIVFFLFIGFILCFLTSLMFQSIPWILIAVLLVAGFYFFRKRYFQIFYSQTDFPQATVREWILLFFWSIFTHPLLDSLTTYGTVLFWPFSDYRISISTVAIVDPLYTIPFAIFLLLAALRNRNDSKRNLLNWIGIATSSAYLILTIINKNHINNTFEKSLQAKNYQYSEYITVPTIFNNLLWYGIARSDSNYVYGYYSLLDEENYFAKLGIVSHNHHLFDPYKGQSITQKLPWFSDGYYSLIQTDDQHLQYNDLRFGSMSGELKDKKDFIFKFNLSIVNGQLQMPEGEERPENNPEEAKRFRNRIMGIK